MKGKSVWFIRAIELAKLDFGGVGRDINILLKIIKKGVKVPVFTTYEEGKRIWISNDRLKLFIEFGVKLGIFDFEEKKEVFYLKQSAKEILELNSRNEKLKELCVNALNTHYKVKIEAIIKKIDEIGPPATVKEIARNLRLPLNYNEFIIFGALLQIYGDVSNDLIWTGKVTFGTPGKIIDLSEDITQEHREIINKILEKSKNKKELNIKFTSEKKKDKKFPFPLEEEMRKIIDENYEEKKAKEEMENIVKKSSAINQIRRDLKKKLNNFKNITEDKKREIINLAEAKFRENIEKKEEKKEKIRKKIAG